MEMVNCICYENERRFLKGDNMIVYMVKINGVLLPEVFGGEEAIIRVPLSKDLHRVELEFIECEVQVKQ